MSSTHKDVVAWFRENPGPEWIFPSKKASNIPECIMDDEKEKKEKEKKNGRH